MIRVTVTFTDADEVRAVGLDPMILSTRGKASNHFREKLGLPPLANRGGKREGAGRKPKKISCPNTMQK